MFISATAKDGTRISAIDNSIRCSNGEQYVLMGSILEGNGKSYGRIKDIVDGFNVIMAEHGGDNINTEKNKLGEKLYSRIDSKVDREVKLDHLDSLGQSYGILTMIIFLLTSLYSLVGVGIGWNEIFTSEVGIMIAILVLHAITIVILKFCRGTKTMFSYRKSCFWIIAFVFSLLIEVLFFISLAAIMLPHYRIYLQ